MHCISSIAHPTLINESPMPKCPPGLHSLWYQETSECHLEKKMYARRHPFTTVRLSIYPTGNGALESKECIIKVKKIANPGLFGAEKSQGGYRVLGSISLYRCMLIPRVLIHVPVLPYREENLFFFHVHRLDIEFKSPILEVRVRACLYEVSLVRPSSS